MPRQPGLFFIAVLACIGISASLSAQSAGTPPPCSSPEFRQFDFWLGGWDLTWQDSGRGSNTITRELGDCVIVENFTTLDSAPFVGRSVSTFSRETGHWQQTWVDNQGSYLDFSGGMAGDSMILSREARRNDSTFLQRMVFYNITPDSLDWSWQRSDDRGATWRPMWDIHYTRRR